MVPAPTLDAPAQYLKGVGPKRAEALNRLGIRTARDLLFHVPRRYEDASTVARIGSVEVGMDATVIGTVISKGVLPTRAGLRVFQAVLSDGTGFLECSWPGQPFLDRTIQKGDLLLVSGPVRFFHGRQIQPREFIVLGHAGDTEASGKVLPIYPATEGLSQRMLRSILDTNLPALLPFADDEEIFPDSILKDLGIPPLREALEAMHHPASLSDAERGRRRLAYEELFFSQLLHARAHHCATGERPGIIFRDVGDLRSELQRTLSFELTHAQQRTLREILADMMSARRMNRLVQGDVGSGKTILAVFAMLLAIENGYQAALMAPTELLAEQHARNMRRMVGALSVDITLLIGRLGARERRQALADIKSGKAQLVIGTHALIQEHVEFQRLGLGVVDEQHRFGVRQRLALAAAGNNADVLVMSATPIPRSLALTLYGDLDLSVLDELPPGRQPVRTALRDERSHERVHGFIREQVAQGRQAYIVYPLVEESEKIDLRAATEEFERLRTVVFPDLRLGLVHGQLGGDEKDATMRAFAAGDIDILVATTVIEVGIDVANATVMVIEHAERFGLSQLHQLRGRVGRGAEESFCILIASAGDEAYQRLGIFVGTNDGFEIARADLRLRGMGDFFGARQHGVPEFRFFNPETDDVLLARARQEARGIIAADPALALPTHAPIKAQLVRRWGDRERLYEVG
jgi:ATP-dependent DNA helicase RecG